MSMIVVRKGSNQLLDRPIYNTDGTVLAPSELSGCICELMQKKVVVMTLVMGADAALRPNAADTALILELTTEITAALEVGILVERYKLTIPDAEFVAQPDEEIPKIDVQEVWISA